jgi:hypothetical protein
MIRLQNQITKKGTDLLLAALTHEYGLEKKIKTKANFVIYILLLRDYVEPGTFNLGFIWMHE